MKTNEIRITIDLPRNEVFEYTLEPKNTPLWVSSIEDEQIDTEQINIGTTYTNNLGSLEVTDYDRNVFCEFSDTASTYVRSYSYRKIDDGHTEIIYFESMEDGSDLTSPMERKDFETLKELLEETK